MGLLKTGLFIVAVGVTVAVIVAAAGMVGISLNWLGIGIACVLIARVFAYALHDEKTNMADDIDHAGYFDLPTTDSGSDGGEFFKVRKYVDEHNCT